MLYKKLFASEGYEETSVSDIMDMVGRAKGMFYHSIYGGCIGHRQFGDSLQFFRTSGNMSLIVVKYNMANKLA